jgi:hypothetical protein
MAEAARRRSSVPPLAVVRAVGTAQRAMVRLSRKLAPPHVTLLELVANRWLPDAIVTVARMGVPEQLEAGPKSVGEIARAIGADDQALYRVLRALARERVFEERPNRVFALTPLSRPLLRSAPNSVRNVVGMLGSRWLRTMWLHLEDAIRSGNEVFTKIYGKDFWIYLAEHPEDGAEFHGAMAETSRDDGPAVAAAFDFSRFETLVDVGGGRGELLGAILKKYPHLHGVLYDWQEPLQGAPATLARYGVSERCECVAGNLFESVPSGKDAYLMKLIVHGETDDAARAILVRCRDAMRPNGKLFLVENVVPQDGGPYMQFLDLEMLLGSHGGRERTRAEFDSLFASAGFRLEQVIGTPGPMSVLVGERA